MSSDVFYFPQRILEETLGERLCEKHAKITPLLLLIQYRLHSLFGEYAKKRQRILDYDYAAGDLPTNIFNSILMLNNKKTDNFKAGGILLSRTFTDNPRYSDAFNWLCCNRNIFIPQRIVPTKKNIVHAFRNDNRFNYTFFSNESVLGGKLSDAILRYQDYADMLYNGTPCSVEKELATLEELYLNRKKFIKQQLVKQGIECFITINQYSAPDLLLCDACNELGIVTKQAEHHTLKYPDYDSTVNKVKKLTFVNEHLLWADSDLVINKNVYSYLPAFNQVVEFKVAGSLELVKEAIADRVGEIDDKRYLTLMLSDIPTDDERVKNEVLSWRSELFMQISKLSQKLGLPVRIRYKPGSGMYDEYDKLQFKRYGFIESESTAESLYYDILCSGLIISTPSSVVEICGFLGRNVCTIDYPMLQAEESQGVDMALNIPLEQLGQIDLSDIKSTDKTAYINFDILTEVKWKE